ncbi:hypothetical protein [Legionella yabuuchiae]|uniref:hypothetical protein n=1 Tax=Legionella yabuuchiae TaxID=376727 RepID=UPI0010545A9A|nr:hypothetical protein [Legionella yabuuchiae]
MGRWLKKLNDMQESELTKLTNPPSVGFVSTKAEGFHKKNNKEIDLINFVQGCLKELDIKPQQVIDNLLSIEDEQDIINKNISPELLRLHIELWLKAGKPYYSGK